MVDFKAEQAWLAERLDGAMGGLVVGLVVACDGALLVNAGLHGAQDKGQAPETRPLGRQEPFKEVLTGKQHVKSAGSAVGLQRFSVPGGEVGHRVAYDKVAYGNIFKARTISSAENNKMRGGDDESK